MKKFALLAVLVILLPSAVFAATFNHNLSYGMTGTDVSQLQQFLVDEGLFTNSITATFGPATLKALVAFQQKEGITPSGYFGPLTRTDANTVMAAHPEWTTTISNNNYYPNVNGNSVHSPVQSSNGVPAGATAECNDLTYSFSLHHSGTCSHHGGVMQWLQ